jgi:glycosyltransferase involved in cell wall biosynthesis
VVEVNVTTEQLRYRVPGGIGTYIRGLEKGLGELSTNDVSVNWHAGRLPVSLLGRAWSAGLGKISNGNLVHATSFRLPPTDLPLVVTVHDLLWKQFPDSFPSHGIKWHDSALNKTLEKARKIVTPSEQSRIALIEYGAKPESVVAIPHGIDHMEAPDTKSCDVLLKEQGVSPSFFLTVGTVEPRKNLSTVLQAFHQANDSLSSPMSLVVVGPKGWIEPIPNGENVKFVGDVTPAMLTALYQKAKLFLYAPLGEGFGLPPLEAMSQNTPVITSPVPSVSEGAQIIDPLNADEIAKAIYMLCTDDAARGALVDQGAKYAQKFRWKNSAQSHVQVWKEVLKIG